MAEVIIFCRVCLQEKRNNFSLYLHIQEKYLPSVIENICGVLISLLDEPEAHICKECALAIIEADEIILKCQESNKILTEQQNILKDVAEEFGEKLVMKNEPKLEWNPHYQLIKELITGEQSFEGYKVENAANDSDIIFVSRATLGSNLSNTLVKLKQEAQELPDLDSMDDKLYVEPEMIVESILETSETKGNNINEATLSTLTTTIQPSMYYSTTKGTKPKKRLVRSREQYLKRKIRNVPVKEPLTLIGGAGIVCKRKPKSFHRAIPNFYFKCELCHEFESNVASYSVTHLNTVHQIDRPAIFKCQFCEAKPFIKNQSLQEHISTKHQQQPKSRDYPCAECGKRFIKNSHLQKHLSVHKRSLLAHQRRQKECGKSIGLKVHMKQMPSGDQPYICKLWDKRFTIASGLHTHIKTASHQ